VADHTARQLNVTFRIDPGPPAAFGAVTVRGTKDVDPALVRRRVPFHAGQRFDPKVEDRLRTDLTSLDVFRTIRIVEGDHLDANGQLPITIEVSEKPHHFVGLSASYGTTEGGAVTAYWGHRNLFGGAEHLRLDATVARLFENDLGKLDYGVGVTFTKPSVWTAQDDLTLQLKALQENPDAYSRRGVVAAAGLQRHISPQFTIKAGLSGEVSRITDFFGTQNYYLLGVPIEADWDTTDSKLDPRTGFRVALVGEPVASFGPTPSFFSASATASAYYPLDEAKKYVLAGKVQIASDLGTSLRGIPAYRRQFAGGGGTVRGYSYQALSPTAANGQIIGGRSLFDASAELRVHVTDTIGVVPFVDIGNAYAASFPDFSGLHVGAGIGLRYFTIVGPLRLDIAFPLNPRRGDPRFAFYVGLGQSF
jgi:translocation and assembly module TamA